MTFILLLPSTFVNFIPFNRYFFFFIGSGEMTGGTKMQFVNNMFCYIYLLDESKHIRQY